MFKMKKIKQYPSHIVSSSESDSFSENDDDLTFNVKNVGSHTRHGLGKLTSYTLGEHLESELPVVDDELYIKNGPISHSNEPFAMETNSFIIDKCPEKSSNFKTSGILENSLQSKSSFVNSKNIVPDINIEGDEVHIKETNVLSDLNDPKHFVIDKFPESSSNISSTFIDLPHKGKNKNHIKQRKRKQYNMSDGEDSVHNNLNRIKKGEAKPKKSRSKLSSSLQDNISSNDLYINCNVYEQFSKGKKDKKAFSTPVMPANEIDHLLKKSVLPSDLEKQHMIPPYEVSLNTQRAQRRAERAKTKGKSWFDMKAPEVTKEQKDDLAVIQMRHLLDPKRFYKRPGNKVLPKFFQTGTIVADATDFYSARVPKKQRKKTLVEELLEDAQFKKYSKKKFVEINEKTGHGRRAANHMKRLKKKKK